VKVVINNWRSDAKYCSCGLTAIYSGVTSGFWLASSPHEGAPKAAVVKSGILEVKGVVP
jgi:hypothetical protein